VDACLARGYQVVIIDDLSTGNQDNLNGGYLIPCSINDPLADIFDHYQFDYVFHLAAQINLRHSINHFRDDAQTNVMGSLNVFDHCIRTKVKRVFFSSTGGAMYDASHITNRDSHELPFDEDALARPSSPYGLSKKTAEDYLLMLNKLHGLNATILRYSNVFGARQNSKGEAGVISIFAERALQDKEIVIFSDGFQSRDFIDVGSIVQANMLALDKQLNGIYNVSSNTQYSVNEVAEKIIQLTHSKSKIVHKEPIAGELLHTRLSSEKLKREGWKMERSFEDGLRETIEYFRQ
jgi:UDP-glucose 4-epimerase